MTAISTAVSLERVSAIVGYEIQASLEGIKAGNLPQRIAVLAEANTANQAAASGKLNFTSAKEVGVALGYGSPAYAIARILRPLSGDLLGGIPTLIYPIAEEGAGETATVITIGIVGTATKNVTHKLKLAGRDQIDGANYTFNVAKDDEAAEISQKIADVINAVIGAPGIGTVLTDDAIITSKWKGLSSAEMNAVIDVLGDSAGLTYTVTPVSGTGTPPIADALAEFGDEWNTIVINGLGEIAAVLDALEANNGNVNTKTGKYDPTIFKPYIALFGSLKDELSEITTIADTRAAEMTNALCPAPNSLGFSFEAAANVAFLYAKLAQDTPQTDPLNLLYPDMPTPDDIGEFADSSKRDQIVKVGGSTVKINSSKYQILDLVTTYHPNDEPATATLFRWVRDLIGVDWNIKYKYALLEEIYVVAKTIIPDGKTVAAANTISPKRWKGVLNNLAEQLQNEALIADADFMKNSLEVQIGESNPNRFETSFRVQRTGTARVLSTTNQTQFKFGG